VIRPPFVDHGQRPRNSTGVFQPQDTSPFVCHYRCESARVNFMLAFPAPLRNTPVSCPTVIVLHVEFLRVDVIGCFAPHIGHSPTRKTNVPL